MSDVKPRPSFLDNFRIHDRDSCAKAIKNGGIAGLIAAGITGILAIAGFFTDSTNDQIKAFLDPWSLIDAVFIALLAIFVLRKSRVASTILVIYFVVSKLILWSDSGGKLPGLGMAVIWFLFYLTAMRGTYQWHKSYATRPTERPQITS
jgi:hypothetical protein